MLSQELVARLKTRIYEGSRGRGTKKNEKEAQELRLEEYGIVQHVIFACESIDSG